jgi:hypothetical protein
MTPSSRLLASAHSTHHARQPLSLSHWLGLHDLLFSHLIVDLPGGIDLSERAKVVVNVLVLSRWAIVRLVHDACPYQSSPPLFVEKQLTDVRVSSSILVEPPHCLGVHSLLAECRQLL